MKEKSPHTKNGERTNSMDPFPFKLPLLLDGATGSNLIASSLPEGVCTEKWILENPDVIKRLQKSFVDAGSDVIYTPTFSANSEKLTAFDLKPYTSRYNYELTKLSKEIASQKSGVLVAGDLSPTGRFVLPYGDMDFFDMFFVFLQQAEAIAAADADLFVIETMHSLAEARAAALACIRQKLPVFVTITVDENGRTLTGASALSCLVCLQSIGVTAFGLNCSAGPEAMKPIIEEIAPYAEIPIIAKPNAGQPDENGTYSMTPDEMANGIRGLLDAGASIVGGCCGTSPKHIAAIRKMLDNYDIGARRVKTREATDDAPLILSNEQSVFFISPDNLETSEHIRCSEDMADELLALEDTCVDVISVDILTYEDAELFARNAHMASLPVMFRSHSKLFLETALILYNGKAAIDSSSEIETEELEKLAQKYGSIIY